MEEISGQDHTSYMVLDEFDAVYIPYEQELEEMADFDVPADDFCNMLNSFSKPHQFSRLLEDEFQAFIDCSRLPDTCGQGMVFQFFVAQTNLRRINLHLRDADKILAKNLLFHILEQCTGLQHLKLNFGHKSLTELSFSKKELTKFLSLISSLQSLSLQNVHFSENSALSRLPLIFSSNSAPESPPINLALNELKLTVTGSSKSFVTTILNHCLHLNNLKLHTDHLSNGVLKCIKNQLTLRTLKIVNEGANPCKSSMWYELEKLQDLEHLTLGFAHMKNGRVQILQTLKFPRLKSLSLNFGLEGFEGIPNHIQINFTSNLPVLEKLSLTHVTFEELMNICERLKNVSRLEADGGFIIPEEAKQQVYLRRAHEQYVKNKRIVKIFNSCPGLQSFKLIRADFNGECQYIKGLYVFKEETKSVLKIDGTIISCIGKVGIAVCK